MNSDVSYFSAEKIMGTTVMSSVIVKAMSFSDEKFTVLFTLNRGKILQNSLLPCPLSFGVILSPD